MDQMWKQNRAQQSRVLAVEMSYLRGACGVTRWEGENNESVYERCGMEACASGVRCGVVEWMKRNTMMWFGHTERMKSKETVKKVYVSKIKSSCRRRPLGRRKDSVKEYMSEREATRGGGLEQARRECLDRKRCRLF